MLKSKKLPLPINGNFNDLQPLHIQVSDSEILYGDAVRVKKTELAGVEVWYIKWPDLPHVFTIFCNWIPEAKKSIFDIALFINNKLTRKALSES